MQRKWVIILVVVVGLLVFRIAYNIFSSHRSEMDWYVEELGYEFSAEIDSVRDTPPGHLYVHLTSSRANDSVEVELNTKLKRFAELKFLIFRKSGTIDILMKDPTRFQAKDSLFVDTNAGTIRIYRADKLISESPVKESLRQKGKPIWKSF